MVPSVAGRVGNHMFSVNGDTAYLLFSMCDLCADTHGESFPATDTFKGFNFEDFEWKKVENSSAMSFYAYCEQNKIFGVLPGGGTTAYLYPGVAPETHSAFMHLFETGCSIGSFWQAQIKKDEQGNQRKYIKVAVPAGWVYAAEPEHSNIFRPAA
jgi:hypothetical protein